MQTSTQTTGASYTFTYLYNKLGGLTQEQYPSGRQVGNVFGAAGRITTVTGTVGGNVTTYASGVVCDPTGPMGTFLPLNSWVTESWTLGTPQKQPTALTAAKNGTLLALGWGYGTGASPDLTNNGNVTSATIAGNGVNASQSFGYDLVNRLVVAAEGASSAVTSSTICTQNTGTWCRNQAYDAWGNGWIPSYNNQVLNFGLVLNSFTPQAASNFDANNRLNIQGSAYDNGGNQTKIGLFNNVYDAENRLTSSSNGVVSATYTYDGDGRRVQKVTGGTTTNYVYDAGGQLAAEYSSSAAQASACGTCYLTADTLGSTRMITDETATPRECHDYLPFGEEIGRTAGCYAGQTSNTLKFTGKERDVETGLDYFGARYLSSAQGRWTSPDSSSGASSVPYADLRDPQTLNLYGYVRNDPLGLVDVNGHFFQELLNWARGNGWINNEDLKKKKTQVTVRVVCQGEAESQDNGTATGDPNRQLQQFQSMIVAATPLLLMAPELAGDGSAEEAAGTEMAAEAGWVRVGRWMSQEELESMQATGAAQESRALGGSRVAFPASSEAYKGAPAGSLYVEYDIPASVAKPAGSGWARIPGPNSVEGRAAAAAGRPAPEMPQVKNIEVVKSK